MAKKVKFTVEFPIRCSPNILFDFFSTANGLGEWFADKVDSHDVDFTFFWNGSSEKAKVIDKKENEFIRFQWEYAEPNEYFELRIDKSGVTNETIIVITDFANKKEIEDQEQLWLTQINELKHRIGS